MKTWKHMNREERNEYRKRKLSAEIDTSEEESPVEIEELKEQIRAAKLAGDREEKERLAAKVRKIRNRESASQSRERMDNSLSRLNDAMGKPVDETRSHKKTRVIDIATEVIKASETKKSNAELLSRIEQLEDRIKKMERAKQTPSPSSELKTIEERLSHLEDGFMILPDMSSRIRILERNQGAPSFEYSYNLH